MRVDGANPNTVVGLRGRWTGTVFGAASLLSALASCFPKVTGAPCDIDSDCPGGQVCTAARACDIVADADAGLTDAGVTLDGGAPRLLPAADIVSGAARMTAAGTTLDAQVGHGSAHARMTGGGRTLEGHAATRP